MPATIRNVKLDINKIVCDIVYRVEKAIFDIEGSKALFFQGIVPVPIWVESIRFARI